MNRPPFTYGITQHPPIPAEGLAAATAVRPSGRRRYGVMLREGGLLTSDTDASLVGVFELPLPLTFTLDECAPSCDQIVDAATALASKGHA